MVDLSETISIIMLNVNYLKTPIKMTEINRVDKQARPY